MCRFAGRLVPRVRVSWKRLRPVDRPPGHRAIARRGRRDPPRQRYRAGARAGSRPTRRSAGDGCLLRRPCEGRRAYRKPVHRSSTRRRGRLREKWRPGLRRPRLRSACSRRLPAPLAAFAAGAEVVEGSRDARASSAALRPLPRSSARSAISKRECGRFAWQPPARPWRGSTSCISCRCGTGRGHCVLLSWHHPEKREQTVRSYRSPVG